MQVNGLQLPDYLVELLSAGRWKRPADVSRLAEMTGVERPQDFTFFGLEGMASETRALVKLYEEGRVGDYYGLTSSARPDHFRQHPHFLDVTRAVVLAGNWDEETICLDYRASLEEPVIVLSVYQHQGTDVTWEIIAPNFISFATHLGL
jgi:hypothetical protein